MQAIKAIFTDSYLRSRVLFVLFILFLTRVLSTVPIPEVSVDKLSSFLENSLFSFLNIFAGGGLSTFSILMLGVGPYITASIIMQLLTVLVPRFKEMYHEEGEMGRRKFNQYSRILMLPLAFIQGFALLTLLTKQGTITALTPLHFGANLIIITAGSMLLVWLGEQINERGIGNGVSLIIASGIIAGLPQHISQYLVTFDQSQIPTLVGVVVMFILVVAGVIYVTEAERPIPITYAKQSRIGDTGGSLGVSTYLPLRLNQAGVVPIIFALSMLLLPQFASQLMTASSNPTIALYGSKIAQIIANQWIYGGVYFALIIFFTYFYTLITFDPAKTAERLQKDGAFIPGFRPGVATVEYVSGVLSRIIIVGALFLGVIAVLPIVVQNLTGITSITLGGTSLLIVISVVLDVVKKVDAQLSMREY